jgi:hypothetical protein
MDCVTYVARYESWSDQPDPMCAPNRVIAVNIQKHARAVNSPGGSETKMSIVSRSTEAECNSP